MEANFLSEEMSESFVNPFAVRKALLQSTSLRVPISFIVYKFLLFKKCFLLSITVLTVPRYIDSEIFF